MVNEHIQQAIQSIEAEREQKIAEVKAKVMVEVATQNAEMDRARDKAVEELQTKLNQDVAILQEQFNKQRQEIIEASEKQKEETTNARINIETASVAAQYNNKLTKLRELIEA
ncbi:MAG: hypothetical protein NC131_01110 [Roseburia sp.]|nr:hypothetical protein [Roseburia sp.]